VITLQFFIDTLILRKKSNFVGRHDLLTVLYSVVVTGQLADKPTRGQSSRGLVNSRTINAPRNSF